MARGEGGVDGGCGVGGGVDAHPLELLRKCDGRTRLGRIVEEMTAGSEVAPDVLEVGGTAAVRRLVALGFMVPVADREEGREHDAGSLAVSLKTHSAPARICAAAPGACGWGGHVPGGGG